MRESSETLGLRGIVARVIPHSKRFKGKMPKRVTDDVIAALIDEELAFTASSDPFEAVGQIRKASKKVVILPLEHRIGKDMSDQIVKDISPDNYLNMDSVPVVKRAVELSSGFAAMAGKKWLLPHRVDTDGIERMTDTLAEYTGMYPYFLQKAAAEIRTDNPPLGFYWTGNDKRVRATTWMRCINGHEYFQRFKRGEFSVKLADKIYADSVEVTVQSKSNPKDNYKYHILRLSIFSPQDEKQYSEWRKLSTVGNVPDEIYRGKVHKKREGENIFFSSYFVSGHDAVADRLVHTHELGPDKEVRVNPFPILTPNGSELVRLLREQTIIGKRGLNMTEMDRFIGADTITGGYDSNFVNWRRG